MSKHTKTNKKAFILPIVIIAFLFITIFFSIINSIRTSKPTLNYITNLHNGDYFDFDSDDIFDNISIITNNSTYSVKIKTSSKEFLLKSKEFDYSLLDVVPNCKINIKYIDFNRDNIPELIISGMKNNIPIFYIFKWNNDSFEEILFSKKNIYGILDYNNSRSPKFLQAFSNAGNSSTEGYLLTNNKVKDITFSNPTIPSLGSIQKFIDLIQAEYEITETPGIFTPYIPSEELGLLWNLDKGVYHYEFQYGYFFDSTWNKAGSPTTIYWILSFKKIDYLSNNKENSELLLYIKTELDELSEFKISSIKTIR